MSKPKIGTDNLEPQFQSSTRAIMTMNESSPTAFQGSNPSDNLKLEIATFEILSSSVCISKKEKVIYILEIALSLQSYIAFETSTTKMKDLTYKFFMVHKASHIHRETNKMSN